MKWPFNHRGQSTTETVLLLPLYLIGVFGLLQACQLGVALLVVNYAASSIATSIVQDDPSIVLQSSGFQTLPNPYAAKFEHLLAAGMKSPQLSGCVDKSSPPTATITVHATARIDAFPLFGPFLHIPLQSNYTGTDTALVHCYDEGEKNLGPFNFSAGDTGYYFKIRGKAIARMNYQGH